MATSQMLREIRQQPAALERTLHSELKNALRLRQYFARRKPRLIVLAARGSSDNAAQFGRYLLEITTGIPVALAAPSVFSLYKRSLDFRDVLLVAISQSGESTDTNLVLERARRRGGFTVAITNEPSSTLMRSAEHVLLVRAGKEKSVAATKTYTGQLMALYLLTYALGAAIRSDELRRVAESASRALELEPGIAALAQRYRFMEYAVVVGRGLNYSNAFEFALKLMETCQVVAEGFSSADFLHGPIAMIERAFPIFIFAPPGATWPGTAQLVRRIIRAKADALIVTDRSNMENVRGVAKRLTHNLCIPQPLANRRTIAGGIEDLYTPIPYIVPAQLFAASLADVKGLDPDRPRSLKKITRTL
jgi:glucosamine--fructose-6-phosphate aminotransferase (isomerizing)